MLQFIRLFNFLSTLLHMFQYISCCSLSTAKINRISGTIPVSIHLMLQFIFYVHSAKLRASQFQYISCCSLSIKELMEKKLVLMFQYISCCSLSPGLTYYKIQSLRFNTSHVVVYPATHRRHCKAVFVSIHLMLQFICIHAKNTCPRGFVSIHLMLQFIRILLGHTDYNVTVSIHLMLQFINCPI